MSQAERIILSKQQKEIMRLFYAVSPTKIVLLKKEYNNLWEAIKAGKGLPAQEIQRLNDVCPAIACEIRKSVADKRLIQSAVFSECVYAQTLANIFRLPVFTDYEKESKLDNTVVNLLKSYDLVPRYIYANKERSEMLIQAGGCGGVDGALIHLTDKAMYSIEFKEAQGARATTADLPKYGEDGHMVVTHDFLKEYPYYEDMLNEHKDLNFFDSMGHNTCDFSTDSIRRAIINAYSTTKKYADVIVTADKKEHLVMLPANQVNLFARLEGEIRGGRNCYKVWTPKKLEFFIKQIGGTINSGTVSINANRLTPVKPRGGTGVSRYKINPLFFVRADDVTNVNGVVLFNLDKVQQLNPCITAKLFFKNLEYQHVVEHYKEDLQ
jgi:hypothetical protein